ncbi:type IV pilin [Halovivax gelatinilyticus]|uniref:type IV pilin n=1 Tax=Halovivax gelatinilyticus TaxID=2961597 RepID=UPI0020CA3A69|nr:type IV pilin N-terminal domain-containing protein [Halovivax gelatinilyticus]
MNGKTVCNKLVGSDEERAVSPVIGVILMVAITVILAAVIAVFVMDIGDDQSSPINAHVNADQTGDGIELSVTDPGSAEGFVLRGPGVPGEVAISDDYGTASPTHELDLSADLAAGQDGATSNLSASTGSSIVITDGSPFVDNTANSDESWLSGTVNIVAIDGDQEEQVGSFQAPE